jgi:hypothetical protein
MENDKTSKTPGSNRSVSDSLHPLVYKAMVGLHSGSSLPAGVSSMTEDTFSSHCRS